MRVRRFALDTIAASPILWRAAGWIPSVVPGALAHQAALRAMRAKAFADAERLFECAALRYRAGLELVPLARLRVHQLMCRALSASPHPRDAERCLEVERRLCRLDRIEAPWPPFPLVNAASLLASWLEEEPPAVPEAPAPTVFEATRLDRAA